jgi:hypothetical protein
VELTVDVIQRTSGRFIPKRGAHRLAPDDPLQTHIPHQPLDGASGNVEPFAHHLSPDLADAVNREVLGEDAHYFGLESDIAPPAPTGAMDLVAARHACDTWMGRSAERCRSARPHEARGYRR